MQQVSAEPKAIISFESHLSDDGFFCVETCCIHPFAMTFKWQHSAFAYDIHSLAIWTFVHDLKTPFILYESYKTK